MQIKSSKYNHSPFLSNANAQTNSLSIRTAYRLTFLFGRFVSRFPETSRRRRVWSWICRTIMHTDDATFKAALRQEQSAALKKPVVEASTSLRTRPAGVTAPTTALRRFAASTPFRNPKCGERRISLRYTSLCILCNDCFTVWIQFNVTRIQSSGAKSLDLNPLSNNQCQTAANVVADGDEISTRRIQHVSY